jgi:hypothetical protein
VAGNRIRAPVLVTALSHKRGFVVPWRLVAQAIDGAVNARFLELAEGSAGWPTEFAAAGAVKLRLLEEGAAPLPPPATGVHVAEAELQPDQIQDLAEKLPELLHATAGLELRLRLRVELGGDSPPSDDNLEEIRGILEEICRGLKLR